MSFSSTGIPEALQQFRSLLEEDLLFSQNEELTKLLALGLSPRDLEVHIERWRAVNDVSTNSEIFEDNCLEALDALARLRIKDASAVTPEAAAAKSACQWIRAASDDEVLRWLQTSIAAAPDIRRIHGLAEALLSWMRKASDEALEKWISEQLHIGFGGVTALILSERER
jgi:hypothetical protein